ncbi:hypothetical protein JRQ81_003001 [Phrynocephalus forsythii]|uniref:Uncharacterized protein n=1 Tax=Phrynocephalus forsythii TaxID=171643 RepID=A0A9Q0XJ13_9SAUR|nr:hypothetical protein JRQ81_003001 [Phrynocephalus forsythii]
MPATWKSFPLTHAPKGAALSICIICFSSVFTNTTSLPEETRNQPSSKLKGLRCHERESFSQADKYAYMSKKEKPSVFGGIAEPEVEQQPTCSYGEATTDFTQSSAAPFVRYRQQPEFFITL